MQAAPTETEPTGKDNRSSPAADAEPDPVDTGLKSSGSKQNPLLGHLSGTLEGEDSAGADSGRLRGGMGGGTGASSEPRLKLTMEETDDDPETREDTQRHAMLKQHSHSNSQLKLHSHPEAAVNTQRSQEHTDDIEQQRPAVTDITAM